MANPQAGEMTSRVVIIVEPNVHFPLAAAGVRLESASSAGQVPITERRNLQNFIFSKQR
jgi:hypothetical protein